MIALHFPRLCEWMPSASTWMRLLSFDPLRSLGVPGARPVKPTDWFRRRAEILESDWLLFPEYWQVNALVYAWKKRIFPSVSTYHLGHDKVQMTRAFEAACPQHVPLTLILPATERSAEEVLDTLSFPFVAKEVRSSMGQGVHRIDSRSDFKRYAAANEVLYVQEYLPIRRDLRVVWVGDQVLSAYWRQAPPGGFHNNVSRGGAVSFEEIPENALELVQRVATALGIDHAGFDIAVVEGHGYLLEFNLLFGTQALNSRGIAIGPVILDYIRRQAAPPWSPDHTLPRAS